MVWLLRWRGKAGSSTFVAGRKPSDDHDSMGLWIPRDNARTRRFIKPRSPRRRPYWRADTGIGLSALPFCGRGKPMNALQR